MGFIFTTLRRILAWLVYTVVFVLFVTIAALLVIGFVPAASTLLVDTIASRISTPDMRIEIGETSGLLSGNLEVSAVRLSDSQGLFSEIKDIKLTWSPLELVGMAFDAESLSIGSVRLDRQPILPPSDPAVASDSGFSLPVTVSINKLSIADVDLAQSIAGQPFHIGVDGRVAATSQAIDLTLSARDKEREGAGINANLTFNPDMNLLRLDAALNEPQGGLVARLAHIPGVPALNVEVKGDGPLSDWKGKLAAALDGKRVLTLDGAHKNVGEDAHQFLVSGDGEVEGLLPDLLSGYFAGATRIDVDATLSAEGGIDLAKGEISSGSLLIHAKGGYDPVGMSDLAVTVDPQNGSIDATVPTNGGDISAQINHIDAKIFGPPDNLDVTANAALASLQSKNFALSGLKLSVHSSGFDLARQSGPAIVQLSVDTSRFADANIDRLVGAPLKLTAPVEITPELIKTSGATLESTTIGGTVSGSYALAQSALQAEVKLFALGHVLPDALAVRFPGKIAIESHIAANLPADFQLSGLKVTSDALTLSGDASLKDNQIAAAINGVIADLGLLSPQAKGELEFALKATGPMDSPAIDAKLTSAKATLAGRDVSNLALSVVGVASPTEPSGKIAASGSIDGQTILADGDLKSADGKIEIPTLNVKIGSNVLGGKLALDPGFLPKGDISFDFPDIGLMAALAGQNVSGSLSGKASFDNKDGILSMTVATQGAGIASGDIKLVKPDINLVSPDVKAGRIEGTLMAEEVSSGANRLTNIDLGLHLENRKTAFELKSVYDNAPLLAKGSLAIAAKISDLPASLANSFSSGLGAEGSISGTVNVTGSAADPKVAFNLDVANAAISQTRSAGVGSLKIAAKGDFSGGNLKLDVNASAAGGLSVTGGGSLAIAGSRAISMKYSGELPFEMVSPMLAAQGLSLSGGADFNVAISGGLPVPTITGQVNAKGARLVDVRRNLAISDIVASIKLSPGQAVIESFTGKLSSGGTITASGQVGITPGSNFPASISVKLANVTYVQGDLATANVVGDLKLEGPLLTAPVLSGKVRINKAGVTIPEKLPSSLAAIDIQHKNSSAAVNRQAQLIRPDAAPGQTQSRFGLNLEISAPSQIFIRGRGLDAELGGTLTLRGDLENPIVSGGFTMKRGRLSIIGKRLDFSSGTITFGGGLVPILNLVATTTVNTTTINVTISGEAYNPTVTFSSSPALPEDEVLAQLIFGQSKSSLSAFQILQLADAAAQLAGGTQSSLFNKLRKGLGVDDLDVTTDSEGNAQVKAGKYINKRTYIEVQQGKDAGSSKAVINLDIGKGVKLQGSAGSDGSGAAGIFYEKEY